MSNVQQQREEMLKMVTETRAYQKTIFKKLDRIEEHLATQNGRINNLEKNLNPLINFLTTLQQQLEEEDK